MAALPTAGRRAAAFQPHFDSIETVQKNIRVSRMNQRLLLLAVTLAAVPAPVLAQAARDNIDALIEEQARANGVPAAFVHQVVKRESNYNPNAKGGSALGLMQIKHATARGLGYRGEASGLYDPKVNLRYGIAYLAGAYRTAKGDLAKAYHYYNRGYYYAAKRQGIVTEVAEEAAPALVAASSAVSFASVFALRPSQDPAAGQALAYAAAAAPAEVVEVPLPPRRPASLSAGAQVASLAPASDLAAVSLAPQAGPAAAQMQAAAPVEVPLPPRRPGSLAGGLAAASPAPSAQDLASVSLAPQAAARTAEAVQAAGAASGAVEVPLPPRRPTAQLLAAFARPAVPAPKAAPVLEATALPPAR
ncbi:transglycosylase SLT domain-containing protein [Methylobacterium nigriterrae]|uniref:transglycosylase SLT domain-containing protein n=1 Tax=Methylobacterium nigriterrae TaxID=3127512 RepID=UPI003D675967